MQTETMNGTAQQILPPQRDAALPAVQRSAATPAEVVAYAMERGASIESIEKMMELQFRWEAQQAFKAFVDDMAKFKLNPPKIHKDKHVSFKTEKGVTNYDHATLGNVTEAIIAGLAQNGFSHRWQTEQLAEGMIAVTCIITHRLGHSESTRLMASRDMSGSKNNIQAMGSTITYLQRYTLLAATGMATHGQDDDGAGSEGEQDPDKLLADWKAKAAAAPNLPELDEVWKAGNGKFEPQGDDWHAFADACNARKDAINTAQQQRPTNRGSRMDSIMRQQTGTPSRDDGN